MIVTVNLAGRATSLNRLALPDATFSLSLNSLIGDEPLYALDSIVYKGYDESLGMSNCSPIFGPEMPSKFSTAEAVRCALLVSNKTEWESADCNGPYQAICGVYIGVATAATLPTSHPVNSP